MANHPSALKRHRRSRRRFAKNHSAKARLRTLTRAVAESVAEGDKQAAVERLRIASQALAKAASKGLLHKSNASRRTARLARRVDRMGGQVG